MTDFSVPRDSRRVPLATRVQLKFEWFSGFISEYSSNISPGGMFIRTQTPEPVGRVLGFEFRLGDGFELIQGTGEVAWVRQLDESAEKPAGMGIRFLELSPHSRELIARMVENYIREGGTPFDVAKAPVPAAPPPAAAAADPPAPPASPLPPTLQPPFEPAPASPPEPDPAPARGTVTTPPLPPLSVDVAGEPSPAERAPWPGALAASAAVPAIEPPERESAAAERPFQVSRIVLWTLFAAFLGGATWVVLSQDLLLGWLTRRGAVAAPAVAPPRAARRHSPAPAAPPVAPAPAPVSVVAATPAPVPPSIPPSIPIAASAPAPAPAAPAVEPPTAAAAPLTEVEKITWQQSPDGTEVVVWGNGVFRRQDYVHYRVEGDPPRVLIKLRGIRRPFAEGRLVVGTRQVRQVRTGFHAEGAGNELHVVLDLAGFGVEVTGMREDAETLHIFLKGS